MAYMAILASTSFLISVINFIEIYKIKKSK